MWVCRSPYQSEQITNCNATSRYQNQNDKEMTLRSHNTEERIKLLNKKCPIYASKESRHLYFCLLRKVKFSIIRTDFSAPFNIFEMNISVNIKPIYTISYRNIPEWWSRNAVNLKLMRFLIKHLCVTTSAGNFITILSCLVNFSPV